MTLLASQNGLQKTELSNNKQLSDSFHGISTDLLQ